MFRVTMVLIIVVAMLLTGCATVAQKAVEQATGVQVDQKGETLTIKGKDGEQLTFSSQMPDELKNFPLPPGFTIDEKSSGSMSAGGDKVAVGSWKGKGKMDDVVAFYKKTMAQQGYTEDFAMAAAEGGQLSYSKGDGGVMITLGKEGDSLTIVAIVSNSPQKK